MNLIFIIEEIRNHFLNILVFYYSVLFSLILLFIVSSLNLLWRPRNLPYLPLNTILSF